MRELLEIIREAAPFAVRFMLVGGSVLWIASCLRRRRMGPVILAFATALYLGFLLHGTCVNRVSSWREFFVVERTNWNVRWNFELAARTRYSAAHALFNVALFVPWGLLGMCWQKRPWMGFLVLLSGILMSFAAETFQLCHDMTPDLGDVLTNSIGTAAGCVLGLPAVYLNRWLDNQRKKAEPKKGKARAGKGKKK